MFSLINKFFNNPGNLQQALKEGAIIIDVRSPLEYDSGHIKGSKNIPLETLKNRISEIRNYNKAIITVCQSGMRSGTAKSFLQSNGISAINGGSWLSLNKIV